MKHILIKIIQFKNHLKTFWLLFMYKQSQFVCFSYKLINNDNSIITYIIYNNYII